MKLADAIATAPRRTLKGTYWHQGPTRHPVTSCADPARGPGRYHRTGEPGVWYASNKERRLHHHPGHRRRPRCQLRRRTGPGGGAPRLSNTCRVRSRTAQHRARAIRGPSTASAARQPTPADPSARTHARLRAQIACNADTCRSRSNPAPTTLKASRPDGL